MISILWGLLLGSEMEICMENIKTKSIFILGASRLQIPAIEMAKEKGLYVYVLDMDPNAIGISMADKFLEISTIDKEGVYNAAMEYKPDYIITSTSDMPVRTVSWVNEKLGKKTDISYQGAVCATDKVAMRCIMEKKGVPVPIFYQVQSYEEFVKVIPKMKDKFIMKPSDNAASRGVLLINKGDNPNYEELYQYCLQYSRNGVILIEEFMEGPEVSVEAYSIDGIPHIITITDKIVTESPFFVELGHTEPSRLSKEIQEEIQSVAIAAITAIGMNNGPTHTEIKVTPSGVKLVEIAARLGGDFITSKLVPLSTGVDLIECSFATLLGEKVPVDNKFSKGAAIRFIQGFDGVLKRIEGLESIKKKSNIIDVEIYKNIGDKICRPQNSNDRIGHVIAIGENADIAAKIAEEAIQSIKVIVE